MINLATRFAAAFVLAIAAAHFLMPSAGYDGADLAAIPDAQREHFVYLGTYAIGFFLLSFAIMTFLADVRRPTFEMTVFLGLMSVVWFARLVLEFLYPVQLSLFFADDPHIPLSSAIALIWIGYTVGFAGHLRARR